MEVKMDLAAMIRMMVTSQNEGIEQAIGLIIKSVTANSVTVAAANGFTIEQINEIMSNRGYI